MHSKQMDAAALEFRKITDRITYIMEGTDNGIIDRRKGVMGVGGLIKKVVEIQITQYF